MIREIYRKQNKSAYFKHYANTARFQGTPVGIE